MRQVDANKLGHVLPLPDVDITFVQGESGSPGIAGKIGHQGPTVRNLVTK